MSYLSAILAAFVILSCPPDDFLEGLTYFEDSPREAKVYYGGNEYIGGMPVGSVLYIFDRKTDKFIGLRVKVTFDEDGEWKEVNCGTRQVPDAIIPTKILEYVTKNFPDAYITEIDYKYTTKRYKVELNIDAELSFDKDGNFVNIDY